MNTRFLIIVPFLGIIFGNLELFSEEPISQINDRISMKNPKSSSGNPISPSKNSLARGKTIYVNKCLNCHGDRGRGDGVLARVVKNIPDFSDPKMWSKSDQELFHEISVGVPPMMPAYQKTIKEEDRWNLVNYIRTFVPKPKTNGELN